MKVSKNFILQEFVSEEVYEKYKEKALWFIDPRIIESAQKIRDIFDTPLTINSWLYGGDRNESGLRIKEHKNYHQYSQHTFGRAVDIVCKKYTAEEIRQHIIKRPSLYPHITGIELNVSWLHIDCRNTVNQATILFNP